MATPQAMSQALPAVVQATGVLRATGNDQMVALSAALDQVAGAVVNVQAQITTHMQDNLQAHDNLQGLINGLQAELATLRAQHDGLQTALTERFVPLETRVVAVEGATQAVADLTQRASASEQQAVVTANQARHVQRCFVKNSFNCCNHCS